jgi:hypothetical protein
MLGGSRLPKKKEVGYQKKEGGRRLPKKRKDQKRRRRRRTASKPEGLNNLGFLYFVIKKLNVKKLFVVFLFVCVCAAASFF